MTRYGAKCSIFKPVVGACCVCKITSVRFASIKGKNQFLTFFLLVHSPKLSVSSTCRKPLYSQMYRTLFVFFAPHLVYVFFIIFWSLALLWYASRLMIKHFRCGKKACVVYAIQDVMSAVLVCICLLQLFRETLEAFPVDLWEAEEVCPNSRKEKTQRGREDEEEGRFLEPERFAEGWRLGAAVRR